MGVLSTVRNKVDDEPLAWGARSDIRAKVWPAVLVEAAGKGVEVDENRRP